MSCAALTKKGIQCSREGKENGCCFQHSIKLKSITKANDKKHKLVATFDINGYEKKTYFGAYGMKDYILYSKEDYELADKRRELYRIRHMKDLRTNDATSPGTLSMIILWGNHRNIEDNIKDYRKTFNL